MKISQSRTLSAIESLVDVGIGFVIAIVTTLYALPLFGFHPSLTQSFGITLIFTVISVIRKYIVRRLFNWLHVSVLHDRHV